MAHDDIAPAWRPLYPGTPLVKGTVIDTANTNRDGTGEIVSIVVGGSFGALVEEVHVQATGTTTAGMVRFFYHDGASWSLIDELDVTAATPSSTVQAFDARWTPDSADRKLTLPPGHRLGAATHNGETFVMHPEGAQYGYQEIITP